MHTCIYTMAGAKHTHPYEESNREAGTQAGEHTTIHTGGMALKQGQRDRQRAIHEDPPIHRKIHTHRNTNILTVRQAYIKSWMYTKRNIQYYRDAHRHTTNTGRHVYIHNG